MTTVNLDNDAIMQTGLGSADTRDAQAPHAKTNDTVLDEKHGDFTTSDEDDWPDKPTEEEMRTLRRVSGKIKWTMWTIAFCELCERFSYYGSSVMYTNFVVHPIPEGSTTGAPLDPANSASVPGVLNEGPKAGQGIALFNQFFTYLTPLLGAWIADARMGRFWTIHMAIAIAMVAHVILVVCSAPEVLKNREGSFAAFIIGMVCLCAGSGFFKANVSPLLAEQNEDTFMRVKTLKSGERVIVDPAVTNTRIFLYFYLCINIGALSGQIGMAYVERYVGFWVAFLIPTGLFAIAPFVLWSNKKNYKMSPPTGSLLSKFFHMYTFVRKRSKGLHMSWDMAKPSHILPSERPAWMTYDDEWIDEVRRGLMACKVFLFLPIYFLAYNQMTGNLTTQASTMELHGTPNDVIQNLNPISIVIMIPMLDHGLYPLLRKMGIAFTPIKRMTVGFFIATLAMVAAAVMQHYIYKMNPECGKYVNGKYMPADAPPGSDPVKCPPAPINVWAQCLPYVLIGFSELLTNVTSYEYAFSKAPENMKSLVMSINLFMSAVSAAIGEAFTPLSGDPLLVINYAVVAGIACAGGIAFWFCFNHLDAEEDKWNMLKKSEFQGRNQPMAIPSKGIATADVPDVA